MANRPVISMRVGEIVARATQPIIDPHNLKIVGWWCKPRGSSQMAILLAEDVRQNTPEGLMVNNEESLSDHGELVRHKEILEINFQLLGKPVKTKRSKLGKVSDFSYNEGLFVQKLYVTPPLVKVFASEDSLIIDRSQIVEVTRTYILVKDTDVKAGAEELIAAVPA